MRRRPPHNRDLRIGRFSQKNQIYLVTFRCNSGQQLFSDLRLGAIVADEIDRSDQAGSSKTFAYVVMPDHLHWLFQLSGDHSLSHIVRRIKGRSARRINVVRLQRSKVWQPGFHDRALRRFEDLRDAGNYILNNPVRAGLVTHFSDYPLLDAAWI